MSQRLDITITCSNCAKQFETSVFRSIWGEHPENRNLVMSDNINVVTCPSCKQRIKIPIALLYVDVDKQFAVWWEPFYDPQIDKDAIEYSRMFGEGNFYQTAPRVKEWERFKETIRQFENGTLKANKIRVSEQQKQIVERAMKNTIKNMKSQNRKNSGCMVSFILIGLPIITFLYILLT